jgi:2-dehydro-3-deoxyphosphogluconate aldolase/(4S)-4-hydroxy-2-oxoglutarate aldolase
MDNDRQALLHRLGVIPVIAIDSVEHALPLADALIDGGLPAAEITFRTAAAAEAIRTLRRERPELLVGAGTILKAEQLLQARACGAAFGVAPGFNPDIVRQAQAAGLDFCPGVMTPSEIENAMAVGLNVLKFFPSELAGGLKMIKALAGPYGHTGLRFIPTGGVSEQNIEAYLAEKLVLAVGGTWIAKKESIAAGKWDEIRQNCRRAVEIVAKARPA